ncbi:hypothetical protein HALLA_03460 (plasmid) [Halostagnicola larsenii XH-48]|uniref:Uncharacterized protein n=1 Tax=Halostagnicola larsenii XH-48 TaxID=797299 RepID=W0JS75_9EURY|nr:hypothetical protein [Halostagnicola larsenii]AHG01459.1 hypothetical protein HALLA_03460 [Halostagnicola larsenii XH-48]
MVERRTNRSQRTESETNESAYSRRQAIRVGTGVATAAVGIAAFGGQAAAHFPTDLEIAVRPNCDIARIDLENRTLIPVAVFQTDEFDPVNEPVQYRFGEPDTVSDGEGARPVDDGFSVDLNGDGRTDLLMFFPTAETDLDGDDSEARLEWERTEDGRHGLAGTASVTIIE